jgi:hypothetical protein
VSLWLNSGVPATEAARRAGHGVAVLLKVYAHCIDGQDNAANKRIDDALGTGDFQAGLPAKMRTRSRHLKRQTARERCAARGLLLCPGTADG